MRKLGLAMMVIFVLSILGACNSNEEASAPADKEKNEPAKEEVVDQELLDAKAKFEPLGEMPVPADNPMTDEKVELGKTLYFDPRLSGNNVQSCMSCHAPGAGYGDGMSTFIGFEGHQGGRNSPTIINSGYYPTNFWDGRAGSLEEQALGPIQSEVEMNQNLDELVIELNGVPTYVEQFNTVFNDQISADNIAKAIAAFERTIVISDTAFDRYLQGEEDAISADAKEGMKLFVGKAGCISCHAGPLLSDYSYHNLGMSGDEGRFDVTGNEEDKGKFRTSGLRGVAHTAPFMHDGSLETLKDVVMYYNAGGGDHANKSVLVSPLNLTDKEIDNLVAFLESMSGELQMIDAPEIPSN
ncbi:cytochrome c peroxidase [Cytobacillus eiseniae]|uniref:Cytochrome c peroxidase n=1 Tax=Cytobacillus eiseniae TaxID=762947 RepID=A0ABS4RH26_9BACI|nr:cytochrome c peroxidase [Cytobacillus eiseniae]MBP2242202.1 cytochrome c peroxidase [Cytobacillus eiseniae]